MQGLYFRPKRVVSCNLFLEINDNLEILAQQKVYVFKWRFVVSTDEITSLMVINILSYIQTVDLKQVEITESSSLIWLHYIEFYKYFHVIKFIVEGDDLIEI